MRIRLKILTLIFLSMSFVYFVNLDTTLAQENTLDFGMSTALSGPAKDLGTLMRQGVEAAFNEENIKGGINNKKLKLVALDDGYEPDRTAPNMRQLVANENILGIIGNVGTPTAVAAIPIANSAKTPFYGAFTGAGVLRKSPPDRYVINYRASYAEETAAMVTALINKAKLKIDEIAFFTQRDSYGDAGFIGGITALKKFGLADDSNVAHGRYERNTTAVENALADILQAPTTPKAIIMVGAYAPCAAFIKLAKSYGLKAIFLNVSFVGSRSLAKELGKQGDGVIITQVVPHYDSNLAITTTYKKALESLTGKKEYSFVSLEGYIAGRILIEALKKSPKNITREGIIDSLESLKEFDIGLPQKLYLDKEQHQASHIVYPTTIKNHGVIPFDWNDLSKLLK